MTGVLLVRAEDEVGPRRMLCESGRRGQGGWCRQEMTPLFRIFAEPGARRGADDSTSLCSKKGDFRAWGEMHKLQAFAQSLQSAAASDHFGRSQISTVLSLLAGARRRPSGLVGAGATLPCCNARTG